MRSEVVTRGKRRSGRQQTHRSKWIDKAAHDEVIFLSSQAVSRIFKTVDSIRAGTYEVDPHEVKISVKDRD